MMCKLLLFCIETSTIALLLQLEELCEMTGGVYCFMAALELPASKDSVGLVHFSAGHPSMLALLEQRNGNLKRETLAAIRGMLCCAMICYAML